MTSEVLKKFAKDEFVDELRYRMKHTLAGTGEGYGEMNSLRNFVDCVVMRQLSELQPLYEEYQAMSMDKKREFLADDDCRELINRRDEIIAVLRELREKFCPGSVMSSIAPHPLYGEEFEGYTARYYPFADEDSRWLLVYRGRSWPFKTLAALKRSRQSKV